MNLLSKLTIISILLTISFIPISLAEEIMITYTEDMDDLVFDGKWTFFGEWKRTSQTQILYEDNSLIQLRTAHQGDFIYVFIDVLRDYTLDKTSDRAMICIDGNNDKTVISGYDDYCFGMGLNSKNPFVLQGGSNIPTKSYFNKIQSPNGFIGISATSDNEDRYSQIPHPSYEFRIPIELFGRSDNYGFYMQVYDLSKNKFYSWPQHIEVNNYEIPSPSLWGTIISPDKSLPELELPILVFSLTIIMTIVFTKFWKQISYHTFPSN